MNLKNNSGRSVKFLSSSFFYFRSYWSWGYQYLLFYREYRHYRHEYCDALHDLVSFVQFKEREKSPWRSVAFIKVVNTPSWVFFTFFKLCKWYQIAERITYRFLIGEKLKPIRSLNTDVRYEISTESVNQLQYDVIMLNDLPYSKVK